MARPRPAALAWTSMLTLSVLVACPTPIGPDGGGDGDGDGDGEATDGGEASDGGSPPDAGGGDGDGDGDGDVPPGFTAATVLYRGSDAIVVGGSLSGVDRPGTVVQEDDYRTRSLALSGDGTTLWAVTHNAGADADDEWRVWAIPTAGGPATPATPAIPAAAGYPGGVTVRTSSDGQRALMVWPYTAGGGAFPPREHAVSTATLPEAVFTQVSSTEDDAMAAVSSFGNAQYLYPRATADGLSLLLQTGDDVWRFDESSGWVPFKVGERDSVMWNGQAPRNQRMYGFDITANGGEWVTALGLVGADDQDQEGVITGMSIPAVTVEAVEDAPAAPVDWLHLDDSGETIAYTFRGPDFGQARSYVGEQGGVLRLIEVDTAAATEITLSDDGDVVHVVNELVGTGVLTSFFEDAATGAGRVKAHSSAFGAEGLRRPELSDDGSVYAALIDIDTGNIVTFEGALLGHRQVIPVGAPTAAAIGYRFDDEADTLVVSAEVDPGASDEVKSVFVLPLLERYVPPYRVLAEGDDPTWAWRFGGDLTPVEATARHEGAMDLAGERASLDGRFSFRLVVVAGPAGASANRASFYDFAVAP